MTNELKRFKCKYNQDDFPTFLALIIFANWIQLCMSKRTYISSEIRSLRFENRFHGLLLFYVLRRTLKIFQRYTIDRYTIHFVDPI